MDSNIAAIVGANGGELEHITPENDDILISSAASCITLNFMGQNFHPVFTHQLFQGEIIKARDYVFGPTPKLLSTTKGVKFPRSHLSHLSHSFNPIKYCLITHS